MYKKIFSIAAFASSFALHAGTMGPVEPAYPWFASIGTGYAWSQNSGISNPDPNFWDASSQGYNAPLGDRGFYSFAIGKQVHSMIDVSLSYINPENFNYQKFQSSVSATPGFTGDERVRFFTLDNRALLVNMFVHPLETYFTIANIGLTPFAGAGIGYARNKVYNFYTVGTVAVGGTSVGSTTSIGLRDSNKNAFAWQGSLGVNINPNLSHFSVDVGYRYYDGGKFQGPGPIYTETASYLVGAPWQGRLKTNQLFVDFKYTV